MSLRTKVVALVLGLTALVLVGVGATLSRSFAGWSEEAVDRDLAGRAAAIAGRVELEDEGPRLEDEDGGAVPGDPAHPWRILGPRGRLLASGADLPWPRADLRAVEPRLETVTDAAGRAWRVASVAFQARGEHQVRLAVQVAVQVAGGLAPYGALEAPFRRGLLVALAGALLLAGLGAGLLAHVSLAPLRRLAADIAAAGPASLDRKIRLDGLDAELRRVAAAFNDLLGRLDHAAQQERQLVSRASHALRTPVATIRTRAEVALRRGRDPEAYRAALADVDAAARDASVLISQLLTLARLDERRAPVREDVALAPVAAEVVRLLAPRAEEAGVALELEVDPGHAVRADRAALRELLEALLDNAVRYTPRGGRAGIASARDGGRLALRVWDTGPGVPELERPKVLERFYRGAAGQASGHPGSGLGLAVVKAIAEANGAHVALGTPPGGGLEVTVSFGRPE